MTCLHLVVLLAGGLMMVGGERIAELEAQLLELEAEVQECRKQHEPRLEARITEMKAALQECRNQHGDNVEIFNCASEVTYEGDGAFAVTSKSGSFPANGVCVVDYDVQGENDTAYILTVDIYSDEPDNGHLGVMFNAQDEQNFDLLLFSVRHEPCNWQTARYVDGTLELNPHRQCPNKEMFTQEWHTVRVEVQPNNDLPLVQVNGVDFPARPGEEMAFPRKAMGGVVVATRWGTRALFRDFHIH